MLLETNFKEVELFKKGKVRDVYKLSEDKLLIVATDRISCFDVILPTPIPDKGKILTKISLFWFSFLKELIDNHLVSAKLKDLPESLNKYKDILEDRFMIIKKCKVIPFECVVRGYITGSAWKEYKEKGAVCGIKLPPNLKVSEKLKEPLFTPATKSEYGHDENVDFNYMAEKIGRDLADKIKDISVAIYKKASYYAQKRGIIIADTKFEFGFLEDKFILVDEVLTSDSSRFWEESDYEPGKIPQNFDKQFVRDYLESTGWNKESPAPLLPGEIVERTRQKYKEALKSLTGESFLK